jgi:hypothetical protein
MDLEPLKPLKHSYITLSEGYHGRTSPTNFFEEPIISFFLISTVMTYSGALKLIQPNGGETWLFNSRKAIKWFAIDVVKNVTLSLWKNGKFVGFIVKNAHLPATNYYWNAGQYIGGKAPAGIGYSIRIEEKGTGVSDFSDHPFKISKLTTGKLITSKKQYQKRIYVEKEHQYETGHPQFKPNLKVKFREFSTSGRTFTVWMENENYRIAKITEDNFLLYLRYDIYYNVDGQWVNFHAINVYQSTIDNLNSYGKVSLTIFFEKWKNAGAKTVTVTIDSRNDIKEANENDNTIQITIAE